MIKYITSRRRIVKEYITKQETKDNYRDKPEWDIK